ncbi:phage tail sheath protein [Clostridium puniceum]|uniref:Phage tail sheath protein n=1 Tax=Clostridium puniceum TaxID=29367 RepID=A0A1S8TVQ2_9CLOT|nr:phage tail sheath C-terminal domain-containing protein [Clostridium puniceum]OOM81791.1 phage tail sheath protein [Clostridium puniceum]
MAVRLPWIDVIFKQLANTFRSRSERGVAILIVRDDTDKTFDNKKYSTLEELLKDKDLYTSSNYQYMQDVLNFKAYKLVVIRINATATGEETIPTIADALKIVEKTVRSGWISFPDGLAADYQSLADWVKAKENVGLTYKAIVYKVVADSKQVVNFTNPSITFKGDRGKFTGDKYLPSLLGILASCNVSRSSTYFICTNLAAIETVVDEEVAVKAGEFILINDVDEIKVGLGINSLQTISEETNTTEDMKYIDIVEAMNLITDDIKSIFKSDYLGKKKNSVDNQMVLVSAIVSYFKELTKENILDPEFSNTCDINIPEQRKALITIKGEASEWDDTKVKNNTYKRSVFLLGDIKILGGMENLKLVLTMN